MGSDEVGGALGRGDSGHPPFSNWIKSVPPWPPVEFLDAITRARDLADPDVAGGEGTGATPPPFPN